MKNNINYGYAGKVLRVDLSIQKISVEIFEESQRKEWIGGTGLGAKIMWDEVKKGTLWNSSGNRLLFGTGPLTGSGFNGAGGFSLVGLGPITGGIGCT